MIFDVEINSAAHYPAAEIPGLVALAEQVGFGAFWKGESNSTDPLILLSAVASRTKTIKLGTAIYHIYGRSPVTLGIQSATLQDLSGGRLLLGLGVANKAIAGWHGGVFDRPLKRAREYIEIVRKVAAGERVEYEGEIYQTGKRFQLSWKPSHPNLPIYLAGLGPQMTKLVGRVSLKELVRESTDLIEKLCIEAALELTDDNRASAAEMLGLSRQSLYVKLRRFGLDIAERN